MASLLGLGAAVPITSAAASAARGTNPPASVPPRAQGTSVSPAAAGAGWIARDFSSAGAVVDQDSHLASQSDTATAILALAAAGDGSNQVRAGAVWLEHNFKTYLTDEGTLDTGRLGLLILAAVAAGVNPDTFGGTAKANDLVARLEESEQMTGASAGAFGTGASLGEYNEALSLLALAAAKQLGTGTRLGEAYLAKLQCPDGGWEYNRLATTTACVKPDPKTYAGPDTNTTALAVMAIVATGGHFSHSPVTFFENSQETNGSFGFYGLAGGGQTGDPNSTAYVIQALIALRVLGDSRFARGHHP